MTDLRARLLAALAKESAGPTSDLDLDPGRATGAAGVRAGGGGAAFLPDGGTLPEGLVLAGAAQAQAPAAPAFAGPSLPAAQALRPAGVLVAFRADDGALILTKRASGLRHHPGQIALPGGKVDPGDAGPQGAALREAEEEVGLPRAQVEILGHLPWHRTITGFAMTPVVGLIHGPFTPRPEAGEVEEAFEVPLSHIADPARYRTESRLWRGTRRYYWVAPWGPYYIWGATACVLRGLAGRLAS